MWTSVAGSIAVLAEFVEDLLHRHGVRAGHPFLQPRERTEQARGFAHVGRLEPQIVIEIRARAVTALALDLRITRARASPSTRTVNALLKG